MSILTRAQKINRQRIDYNVPAVDSPDIRVPIYFPLDEAGTQDIYNIGRITTIQEDFDFIAGGVTGDGGARSLNVTANLTGKLAPDLGVNKSFAIMYVVTGSALASWNQFKLGVASGTKGEIDLTLGDVTISQVTGTVDNLTYTTIGTSTIDVAIVLLFDQPSNEWRVYEALEGNQFTLKASMTRTISVVVLSDITSVTFNNTVAALTYGAASYHVEALDTSFPDDFLANLATTKDNWIAGNQGLIL